MRALIYLNWYSTETSGVLPAQTAAAQVAAGRGDVNLMGPSVTDANTNTALDPSTRPGMAQILNAVDQGLIDCVIVGSLDRLAQDAPNFSAIMQRIRVVAAANIISGGGWDTITGDDGSAVAAMLGGL